MSAAARRALMVRDGLRAVAEWEEHGKLTEADLEAARRRVAYEWVALGQPPSA